MEQALSHPDAPSREDFDHELLQIVSDIDDQWATLASSHTNAYRRVMIDIGHSVPIFSVQALLRPDGVIELEKFSIDWDYPLEQLDD